MNPHHHHCLQILSLPYRTHIDIGWKCLNNLILSKCYCCLVASSSSSSLFTFFSFVFAYFTSHFFKSANFAPLHLLLFHARGSLSHRFDHKSHSSLFSFTLVLLLYRENSSPLIPEHDVVVARKGGWKRKKVEHRVSENGGEENRYREEREEEDVVVGDDAESYRWFEPERMVRVKKRRLMLLYCDIKKF